MKKTIVSSIIAPSRQLVKPRSRHNLQADPPPLYMYVLFSIRPELA